MKRNRKLPALAAVLILTGSLAACDSSSSTAEESAAETTTTAAAETTDAAETTSAAETATTAETSAETTAGSTAAVTGNAGGTSGSASAAVTTLTAPPAPDLSQPLNEFLEGSVWAWSEEFRSMHLDGLIECRDGNIHYMAMYLSSGCFMEETESLSELTETDSYAGWFDQISADRMTAEVDDTKLQYVGRGFSDLYDVLAARAGYTGPRWSEITDHVTYGNGFATYEEAKDQFLAVARKYSAETSADAALALLGMCNQAELEKLSPLFLTDEDKPVEHELGEELALAVLKFYAELTDEGAADWSAEVSDLEYSTAAELELDSSDPPEAAYLSLGLEAAAGYDIWMNYRENDNGSPTCFVTNYVLFVQFGGRWYLSAGALLDELFYRN